MTEEEQKSLKNMEEAKEAAEKMFAHLFANSDYTLVVSIAKKDRSYDHGVFRCAMGDVPETSITHRHEIFLHSPTISTE
ncbi:hypothetical protein [Paenibacillus silvae]|uniref:Uncharacterized protein n=1 Tax=Paenibacillus silvae TaxID=1325358 RepID=A0A2W6NDV9_9BACL|nr:hypothetical protein [Paenibacillus silvae]PZT54122.1 hypothetical protein DN757_19015 [Paenibacillus silvae]